jgi:multidrug efflux pump subunit AcrA (membrane-fusion protein)
MKKILHKKMKWFVAAGIVVILVVVVISMSGGNAVSVDIAEARIADLQEKVTVTGKVTPFKRAELGFEKSGTLSQKKFKVGDKVKAGEVIASLDVGEAYAALRGAEANLNSEEAKFIELEKGLRPEELSVEKTKVTNAQITYDNAKADAINSIRNAYSKIDAAIRNQTDVFFTNPQTANPIITLRTESTSVYDRVNLSRLIVGEHLAKWKTEIDSVSASSAQDVSSLITASKTHIDVVKGFFGQLVSILNVISTGNSGLTQSAIDTNQSTMNTAYANFVTAASAVATADSGLNTASSSLGLAKDQFSLKSSGASTEAIEAQQAHVEQASANVASYSSALIKSRIISPVDGIITKADPEVGEFVSAGTGGFAVMSDSAFKIEVNVPEVDIAKIAVGNKASITLDAYDDSMVFSANVTLIDPAETIIEGVPTYKVTLQFDDKDARIRSGMTANIDLITASRTGVVVVPARAVRTVDGKRVVRVVGVDGSDGAATVDREVTTGLRGSDGNIEIVSGLTVGEKVATSVK